HGAPPHATQGIWHPLQQADACGLRWGGDAGEYRRHGRRGGGISERGRVFDRHRHAAQQKFVAAFKQEFQSDPDLFAADTYGLFYLFKRAIEKAGSTDEQKLRAAMEDATWETPQGTKKMRKGDHQAIVDMVVVKVSGNDFHTVGKVP